MADKSCYMGAGGYTAPSTGSGFVREEYAYGSSSSGSDSGASGGSSGGGSSGNAPGVFKARTDQSCYLGPS